MNFEEMYQEDKENARLLEQYKQYCRDRRAEELSQSGADGIVAVIGVIAILLAVMGFVWVISLA